MPAQQADATSERRFEEAAEWYLRLRGELSIEQLLEWERWYSIPGNQEALDAVKGVSPLSGKLRRPVAPSAASLLDDDYDGSVSIEEWRENNARSRLPPERPLIVSRWNWPRLAIGAGLAAAMLLALLLTFYRGDLLTSAPRESLRVFQTKAGQHEDVMLPDGSRVILGARTKLSAHYSDNRRVIFLDGGEALFDVAKDRTRPFTVVAAGGTITAVGTRFNVRACLNRVTVTVAEGAVNVAPQNEPSLVSARSTEPEVVRKQWRPARLEKGQEVTYEESGDRESVAKAEPGATEWVTGRLQYRQMPLRYVAADVERYFNKPIILGDPAVGDMEFTGTIYQAEVGDWFRALEKIFPLDVSQSDGGAVLIRSREVSDKPASPR